MCVAAMWRAPYGSLRLASGVAWRIGAKSARDRPLRSLEYKSGPTFTSPTVF